MTLYIESSASASGLSVLQSWRCRTRWGREKKKKLWVQGLMGDDLFWDKTAQLVNSASELTLGASALSVLRSWRYRTT